MDRQAENSTAMPDCGPKTTQSKVSVPTKRSPILSASIRRSVLLTVLCLVVAAAIPQDAHSQQAVRRSDGTSQGMIRSADSAARSPFAIEETSSTAGHPLVDEELVSPDGLRSSLKVLIAVTLFSLAPSLLIMTTSFVRFIVVLGLLRQALGAPQIAPNQVTVALSLFLTFLVMAPVWQKSYDDGIRPYTSPEPGHAIPSVEQTVKRTLKPVRGFMAEQIERAGNSSAVWTFLNFQRSSRGEAAAGDSRTPETYEEIPLSVLLPAFVVSELKVAFIIGFQIFLPFLVIDLVVSSVLVSMGMLMLPPAMVSLPMKLLLFVLIDGWSLTAEMLLRSVTGVP